MPDPYVATRQDLKLEILARVTAGATLRGLSEEAGMPSPGTVRDWRRDDPWFAGALAEALRVGAWRRRWRYDPVRGEAFLARYRTGARMADILRDPAMPSRAVLDHWRRTEVGFGEAVEMARRALEAHRLRGLRQARTPQAWDARAADRVLFRVGQGEPLRTLHLADPTLPRPGVVARWRRERPDFDHAMRVNLKAGRRKQRTSRRRCAVAADAVLDGIAAGASLNSLGGAAGLPSRETLSRWVREQPDFAAGVAAACDLREDWYRDAMAEVLVRRPGMTAREMRAALAPWSRQLARLKHRPGRRAGRTDRAVSRRPGPSGQSNG